MQLVACTLYLVILLCLLRFLTNNYFHPTGLTSSCVWTINSKISRSVMEVNSIGLFHLILANHASVYIHQWFADHENL